MPLPSTDTTVLYANGPADPESLTARAVVLHLQPYDADSEIVLLDRTPAHPVDRAWPDQGSDRGTILADERELPLLDVVVGATDSTNLFVGDEVPVRRGEPGWAFVVAHIVPSPSRIAVGDEVTVAVDAAHRRSLSIGHTLCHVASLALNDALTGRWSKPTREDALGHPDFDHEAIQSSTIVPDGSVDVFRLNKSLRRKGFATDGLAEALEPLADTVAQTLDQWIAADAPVRIVRDGDGLSSPRFWECELPEGTARIACGGTHVTSLGELRGASVALELGEDAGTPTLTMRCAALA